MVLWNKILDLQRSSLPAFTLQVWKTDDDWHPESLKKDDGTCNNNCLMQFLHSSIHYCCLHKGSYQANKVFEGFAFNYNRSKPSPNIDVFVQCRRRSRAATALSILKQNPEKSNKKEVSFAYGFHSQRVCVTSLAETKDRRVERRKPDYHLPPPLPPCQSLHCMETLPLHYCYCYNYFSMWLLCNSIKPQLFGLSSMQTQHLLAPPPKSHCCCQCCCHCHGHTSWAEDCILAFGICSSL